MDFQHSPFGKSFQPIGKIIQFSIIPFKVNHLHLQQYYTDFRVPAEDIECDAVTSAVCSGRFYFTKSDVDDKFRMFVTLCHHSLLSASVTDILESHLKP